MKKLLSLFMLLALFASCSSDDDDNNQNDKDKVVIDDKLIKTIEIYDLSDGSDKLSGMMNIKYDNECRPINIKTEEKDYNGGTSSLKETMFSYSANKISFSTMNEQSFSVWMTKGFFELNKHGRVDKSEITEGNKDTRYYTYKYDGDHMISSHMRTRGCISKTSMEWSLGNIVLFELAVEDDLKGKINEYERVEYNSYYNNASIDLARMICFGTEGSEGVALMCGAEEAKYLDIAGARVKFMPSKMTELREGVKVVKDFEYARDRNNRVYEIKVNRVSTFRNEETETKVYKYLIGY